jgi:glyoxylase-like metal-dependent hydrolase (beta-lactamase superfamily II)
MLLKRFYDDPLAQASFLVGDTTTHEAIVVDPNRDVEAYVAAAESEGMRIVAVTETHIHADYCSGTRELAQARRGQGRSSPTRVTPSGSTRGDTSRTWCCCETVVPSAPGTCGWTRSRRRGTHPST